ncbi:trypsin-like [Schistocerca piceifrons]|uniref:trypsin-like n=1 Tax=Schistocerca piceifrons TaxID=274613 RepID=UPI001F5E3937|nr:trypsin-like [Schistocerca piceifrons]
MPHSHHPPPHHQPHLITDPSSQPNAHPIILTVAASQHEVVAVVSGGYSALCRLTLPEASGSDAAAVPCHSEVDSLSVVSGTTSLSYGGTRHQLSGVLVHPGYDPVNFWRHDIALLKVVEPFRLDGSKVGPARLPRQDQIVPVDAVATVVGWGLVEEGGTTPSERLQKAELRVTSQRDCKAAYDKIDGVIHDTNLCAGVADGSAGPCKMGYDSCRVNATCAAQVTMRRIRVKLEPEWSPAQGDSGGPLFVGGKLVGLTSWGAGCKSRFPAVFTRVACYVDWIQQHIQ